MVTNSTSVPRTTSSGPPSLLREQLAQFNGTRPASSTTVGGRHVLGWFLIVCGVCVSGWVLYCVHTALFHPERLGLPLRLIVSDELSMTIPSGKIEVPVVGVRLAGYLLTVLLLAIGAKIAVALINHGSALLWAKKEEESPPES